MYTLGIETSCDETSCAILKNCQVLSNVTLSSLNQHKKYGGVIPEIATRAHLEYIDQVTDQALFEAKISKKKIDLVAATYQPGLIGAVVIGLNFAKALALGLNRPFIGINHLHAHLFASFLDNYDQLKFPFIGLVVSGGHTDIYLVKDFDKLKLIGQTADDACGEVYDKVARYLDLGYPGGPVIDKMFDLNLAKEFVFRCGREGLNTSFSGIKTAVMYKAQELEKNDRLDRLAIKKLVSCFQYSVIETIVSTVFDAAKQKKVRSIVCGGGVIANTYLRQRLEQEAVSQKINLVLSSRKYSTDNAAMVAGLGFYLYNSKDLKSRLDLKPGAN